MNTLIVGGSGSIGGALAKALWPVWIWDRKATESDPLDVLLPKSLVGRLQAISPEIVYHCAGLKYVDQCELDPMKAVEDNLLTTYRLVHAAKAAGVNRLVFLSTDKAVHPTSVMGMAKHLAEEIVVQAGYTAIRLVNVMGSVGSVYELWRKAKAEGKPIPLTDPSCARWMMTMDEAIGTLLSVAHMDAGLYAVSMPEPKRMGELAQAFIEKEYPEGHIEITGLRPGERLEELVYEEGTSVEMTSHPNIQRIYRKVKELAHA